MIVVLFRSENSIGRILFALLLLSQSQECNCSCNPAPKAVSAKPNASKTTCTPLDVAAIRLERWLGSVDVVGFRCWGYKRPAALFLTSYHLPPRG